MSKRVRATLVLIVLAVVWVIPLVSLFFDAGRARSIGASVAGIDAHLLHVILFSAFVSAVPALFSCVFGTMAGYAISKKRFVGRNILYGMLLGVVFFPPVVFMMPLFKIVSVLRIYDTPLAFILPSAVTAFSIIYMKSAVDRISSSIFDAARIDGIGELAMLKEIVYPLTKGPLAALFVLQFLANWGALAMPLAVADSPARQTLAVYLALSVQKYQVIQRQELLLPLLLLMIPAAAFFFLKPIEITRGVLRTIIKCKDA